MEGRNFHTALIGGFRKKDVVSFLAEDKRRQEEDLQSLQQQLADMEGELSALRAAREREALEADALREQLEAERLAAGQEKALLEAQVSQLEEQCCAAAAEKAALEGRIAQMEAQLEARQESPIDPDELKGLHEELMAEQERVRLLSAQLCQQENQAKPQGMDQLWSLCGKMERTLRQMERMLDGPYRMTCYPEPAAQREEAEPICQPAEEPAREEKPIPAPAPAPVPETSSVKNLLQRIRVKR